MDRRLARIDFMRALRLPAAAGLCAVLALAAGSVAAAGEGGQPTAASNRARALADAHALLALMALPAGAVRVSGPPAGAGPIDDGDPSGASPNLVDAHRWWRAPGTVDAVVAAVRAHPPRGSTFGGSGTGSAAAGGSTVSWTYLAFDLPPRSGVIDSRSLVVKVISIADAMTAVRVDAEDIWETPRAASERVPAGVHEIGVASGVPGKALAVSASVTDPAQVRSIVSRIDRLPVAQPGVLPCPMLTANGPTVTFTFRAATGGRVLAQATQLMLGGPSGPCDPMRFTIAGAAQTPLLGGSGFVAAVGTLLGLELG